MTRNLRSSTGRRGRRPLLAQTAQALYNTIIKALAYTKGISLVDINKLVKHCKKTLDLKNANLSDSYYYTSLPLCIIDAVYSIGVRYTSTYRVVERYCKYYDIPMFRSKTFEYPCTELQLTVSSFTNSIESLGVEHFANNVFSNLQKTSTKSGILKAEAVYLWAKIFERHGVEVFQDLNKIDKQVENKILSIKGQKSGISLSYFLMLSGSDDLCKPDRHILRFISEALQQEVKNPSEAQSIIHTATEILKKTYPHITVKLLDNTIWKYMSKFGRPRRSSLQ